MKRVGFTSEKAGVGGSRLDQWADHAPVMGAAAFLMVEYVGIPYVEVIKHAFLPAIITYIALLYIVHLEALRSNMKGLARPKEKALHHSIISFAITVASLVILSGLIYYGVGWTRQVFGPVATLILVSACSSPTSLWSGTRPRAAAEAGRSRGTGFSHPGSRSYRQRPLLLTAGSDPDLVPDRGATFPGLSAFWAVAFMMFIMLTQRPLIALFRKEERDYLGTVVAAS